MNNFCNQFEQKKIQLSIENPERDLIRSFFLKIANNFLLHLHLHLGETSHKPF